MTFAGANVKTPFPWFGGKSRAANLIWQRFGNVKNYVEPFAGSLAVLLFRPPPNPSQTFNRVETVNDKDAYLANFWRATSIDPQAVAHFADWPVNEADLHARHIWLTKQVDFRENMLSDPDFFDPKIAGWWAWGLCQWIGSGWCDVKNKPPRQLPHLGNPGTGVHRPSRKRPHLANPGKGVHRPSHKRPHLHRGIGEHRPKTSSSLPQYFQDLANRLRYVRVCCGDWTRVLGKSPTFGLGLTGILLDPPYSDKANRTKDLYAIDDLSIAHEVKKWAIENGKNPLLRIALCGYEEEHAMPTDWDCVEWKAHGGYSNSSSTGNDNKLKERIWFSPHCLTQDTNTQLSMFVAP